MNITLLSKFTFSTVLVVCQTEIRTVRDQYQTVRDQNQTVRDQHQTVRHFIEWKQTFEIA